MEENNSKEISLIQLISLTFRWLAKASLSVIRVTGSLLQLAFKYKWTVIVVMILCVIAGQYLARPSARVYKAEAMAMIYGSDAQTVKEILKQIVNTNPESDELSLAKKISIPDSISKNIVSVKTFDVIDYLKNGIADKVDFKNNHSLEDTMNLKMNDRIYIQIKTLSIAQVPLLQGALIKYFEENPVLIAKFEAGKKNFNDRIAICNTELSRIDSLAKVFYFKNNADQLKYEDNKLILGENKKQLFYDEMLRLNAIKGEAESKLAEFSKPVNFPSDFVVSPNPVNGRLKYGVISLIIGAFLSLFIVLLIDNIKKIFAFLQGK